MSGGPAGGAVPVGGVVGAGEVEPGSGVVVDAGAGASSGSEDDEQPAKSARPTQRERAVKAIEGRPIQAVENLTVTQA